MFIFLSAGNPEHVTSLEKLQLMIYAVYRPYLIKYKTFEEVALSNELNNIKLVRDFFFFICMKQFQKNTLKLLLCTAAIH